MLRQSVFAIFQISCRMIRTQIRKLALKLLRYYIKIIIYNDSYDINESLSHVDQFRCALTQHTKIVEVNSE